jgi:hypothetical protein
MPNIGRGPAKMSKKEWISTIQSIEEFKQRNIHFKQNLGEFREINAKALKHLLDDNINLLCDLTLAGLQINWK